MRALVTGATGFVGANVVEALCQDGWHVRALFRSTSSMAALKGLDFEPVPGDILDPESLAVAMAGVDAVFHVAGVTSDFFGPDDHSTLYQVNVEGTRHVAAAALKAGVPRLVHTSSVAALGFSGRERPLDESRSYDLPPSEFPYGHSKLLGEQEIRSAVASGLHAVIVNPTVVMGPRDVKLYNSRIIFEVKRGLIPFVSPGGNNLVDAGDLARGHLLALERGQPGQRYILGGHNGTNVELAREIATVLGVRPVLGAIPRPLIGPLARIIDGVNWLSPRPLPLTGTVLRMMARYYYADSSKAERELGYRVRPLRQTIRRAVDWLEAEGHLRARRPGR